MSDSLVILAVATEWSSGFGGLSTVNRELCAALASLGHDVHCIVLRASDADVTAARAKNVALHVAGSPLAPDAVRLALRPGGLARVDAIIGHGRVTGWGARFQATWFPAAVGVHIVHVAPHATEWFKDRADAAQTAEERAAQEADLASQAQICFAIGPLLRALYETRLHGSGVAIHELLPGLSAIRQSAKPPPRPLALVLCRAEDAKLKGLDIAARAMGRVAQSFSDSGLVVRGARPGGGGALRDELKAISGASPLEVEAYDFTADQAAVEADIMRASVVLLPSRGEGFGMSALEGISAGIPTIVAARSGVGRWLEQLGAEGVDVAGSIVAVTEDIETDARAWEDAIRRVLQDRRLAFERAAKLRAELENRTSWTRCATAVVSRLLDARNARATGATRPRVEIADASSQPSPNPPAPAPTTSAGVAGTLRLGPAEDVLRDEYSEQIDRARTLLQTYRPAEALRVFEDLKDRVWEKADAALRYRIEANRGVALALVGRHAEAGAALIAALSFKPADNDAICRAASGHLMLAENARALELVDQLLKRDQTNAVAHSIRIEALADMIAWDELVGAVPEAVRKSIDVAYAFGRAARRLMKNDEAITWFRIAAESRERGFHAEVNRALAEALFAATLGVGPGGDLSPDALERLVHARTALDEAYAEIADGDANELKLQVLIQRAGVKDVLNDLPGASADLERAASIAPHDARVLHSRALLAFQRKDFGEARQLLSRIDRGSSPDAAAVLADVLRAQGDLKEAVHMLEGVPAERFSPPAQEQRQKILCDAYVDLGLPDKARALVEEVLARSPRSVRALVRAARVARRTNDDGAKATSFIESALRLLDDDTPNLDRSRLADELFARSDYVAAAELYEQLANPVQDSQTTRRLLWCYERIGDVGKALSLAAGLRSRYGPLEALTTLECALLEEIGDLPRAAEVCAEALAKFPRDLELRARRAWLALRRGRFEEADGVLAQITGAELLDSKLGPFIARMFHLRGLTTRAVEIMYDLRRERFDDPQVHLAYVQMCFSRGEATLGELEPFPARAAIGTAVQLKDRAGNTRWWIIEDRAEPNAGRGELPPTAPIAQALLGHAVDDVVDVPSAGAVTVVALLSKFVRALRESLELLGTAFPQQEGLQRVAIEPGDAGVKKISEIVDAADDRRAMVRGMYAEGKLTVGACAQLLSVDTTDAAAALSADPEIGLHVAAGRDGELAEATDLLRHRPTLVMDRIAFASLRMVGALEEVTAIFGKPCIVQASIDDLVGSISRKRTVEARGFATLEKSSGGMLWRDITPEEVDARAAEQEALLKDLRERARVIPLKHALAMKRSERGRLVELLGADATDTAIASADQECVLYSDDLHLRELAAAELGSRGVWTQAVLAACKDAGALTSDEYLEATTKLAAANHRHTSIDDGTLVHAARREEWLPGNGFRVVAAVLGGRHSNLQSAVIVAVRFLRRLWLESPLPIRRGALAIAIVEAIRAERPRVPTLRALEAAVRQHFALLPLEQREVLAVIRQAGAT